MFNRRLTPKSLLMLSLAAVLFSTSVAQAQSESEIQKYVRFQKDLTNTYKHDLPETVVVWVGWDHDEAFEVYKNLSKSPTVTHVFMKDFVGATKKSIVVGKKGFREKDIRTDHLGELQSALTNPPVATPAVWNNTLPGTLVPYCPTGTCPTGRR